MFEEYLPTHQAEEGDSVYADAINHCKNYHSYLVPGSQTSSVHEITHGINADLRNQRLVIKRLPSPIDKVDHTLWIADEPVTSRRNAFYLLKNRAIRIDEPNCRKSDASEFIPQTFRGYRYGLYVAGQREWDDTPLYLYDEWSAYANGAMNVIDASSRNEYRDGNTDYIAAPVEFIAYGLGVCMAAHKTNSLSETLRDFTLWMILQTQFIFIQGMKVLPWKDAEKTWSKLFVESEGKDYRSFLQDVLGYTI